MNARLRSIIRGATVGAAGIAVLCTAVLFVDYAAARYCAPREDRRIEELQKLARTDAAQAPKLEAEHKRVTAARDARRWRIDVLSLVLMAASAAFIAGAKTLAAGTERVPAKPDKLAAPPQTGRAAGGKLPPAEAHSPAAVEEILAREGRGREAAIPVLQAIQSQFGYLPAEALRRVCELTEITPAQISGTASFYGRFRREPSGRHVVRVCHGTACHVSGARQITEELRRSLRIPRGGDTDPERMFTLEEVACLGCCSLAPVLMVDEHAAGKLTPSTARSALDIVAPGKPA